MVAKEKAIKLIINKNENTSNNLAHNNNIEESTNRSKTITELNRLSDNKWNSLLNNEKFQYA